MQKVKIKKSNASSDHPRKQATNVFLCTGVSRRKFSMNSIYRSDSFLEYDREGDEFQSCHYEIPSLRTLTPEALRASSQSPADASICLSISNQQSAIDNSSMPDLDLPQ